MAKILPEVIERLKQLSCEEVAMKLGMEVVKHRTLCFMHDDHHPSLAFRGASRERWFCFVCNKGGDAIQLVMEADKCSFVEACEWLCQEFGIPIDYDTGSRKKTMRVLVVKRKYTEETRPFSSEVAQWLFNHGTLTEIGKQFLFQERKLDPEVISQLHIVSIEDARLLVEELQKEFDKETLVASGLVTETKQRLYFRLFAPCLVIPYYNREKKLVGIQSRYLGSNAEAPRFQFVSNQRSRMFNLPILNELDWGDDLYISEGITDCLALLSAGKKAVAIPSATLMPSLDLVQLNAYRLHMYPDHDEAGMKAFKNLQHCFISYYKNIRQEFYPAEFKDYCEYYLANYVQRNQE